MLLLRAERHVFSRIHSSTLNVVNDIFCNRISTQSYPNMYGKKKKKIQGCVRIIVFGVEQKK